MKNTVTFVFWLGVLAIPATAVAAPALVPFVEEVLVVAANCLALIMN